MIWTIIAIVFSGLGAAGVALILRKLSRNKLPKWIIPVFAGLGMLGYQISYEYSWFEHQQARQPDAAVVVSTEEGTVFWRPWTYFFPMIIAYTVIDTENMVQTDAEEYQFAEFILYRFEKQHVDLVSHQAYLLNCTTAEMVPIDQQRQPNLSRLEKVDVEDLIYVTACG